MTVYHSLHSHQRSHHSHNIEQTQRREGGAAVLRAGVSFAPRHTALRLAARRRVASPSPAPEAASRRI